MLQKQVLTQMRAPLFPKLRGQFAEFLNVVYLEHLGLLDLPTCVGLRYGRFLVNTRNEVFLGSKASTIFNHPRIHEPITSQPDEERICLLLGLHA